MTLQGQISETKDTLGMLILEYFKEYHEKHGDSSTGVIELPITGAIDKLTLRKENDIMLCDIETTFNDPYTVTLSDLEFYDLIDLQGWFSVEYD